MKTDIKPLLEKIDFQPENVFNEAAHNAALFWKAAEFRLECLRNKNVAEMDLETLRAKLSLSIRKIAAETGTKITEDGVKAQITVSSAIAKAQKAHMEAEEAEELSKLLVEAFRMRRDLLKVIAELVHTDSSMQNAVVEANNKLGSVRGAIRKKYQEELGS